MITISLWTFNIVQIPLHRWHLISVLCTPLVASVYLSGAAGVGLWAQALAIRGSVTHVGPLIGGQRWVLTDHF